MKFIQRLEKLEAATKSKNERVIRVIKRADESDNDCIERHGHTPDEPDVMFIIRSIVAPNHEGAPP